MRLKTTLLALVLVGCMAASTAAPAGALTGGCNILGGCNSLRGGLVMTSPTIPAETKCWEGYFSCWTYPEQFMQASTGFPVKTAKGEPGILTIGRPLRDPRLQAPWTIRTPGGGSLEVGPMLWAKYPCRPPGYEQCPTQTSSDSAVMRTTSAPPMIYGGILQPELLVEGEAIPTPGQTICIHSEEEWGTECSPALFANESAVVNYREGNGREEEDATLENVSGICANSGSRDFGTPAWVKSPKGEALAVGEVVGIDLHHYSYTCANGDMVTFVLGMAGALKPPVGGESVQLVTNP